MSTSGISLSSVNALDPTAFQNVKNRVQKDFTQISQSLQSNDLAGAQKAYSDLVQLSPGAQAANQTQTGSTTNPVQSDFASLGQALQSGNLSGAQTAFSKLQTDLSTATQGTPQAGHHRHHHHASSSTDAATTTSTADSTTSAASATSAGILGSLVKTGLSLLG